MAENESRADAANEETSAPGGGSPDKTLKLPPIVVEGESEGSAMPQEAELLPDGVIVPPAPETLPDASSSTAADAVPETESSPASTAVGEEEAAAVAGRDAESAAQATSLEGVAAFTDAAIAAKKEGRANRKRTAIVLTCVLALVLVAYVGGFAYYSSHFLPHTVIGPYNVSNQSAEDAQSFLEDQSKDYTLTVTGGGLDFEVTPEETGLQLDGARVVANAMKQNDALKWPLYVFDSKQTQDLTDAIQTTFDENGFTALVQQKVDEVNATATDSVSASIGYDPALKGFAVIPEQIGTKLDPTLVIKKVEDAAFLMEKKVTIGEDELQMPPIRTNDPRLEEAVKTADGMIGANFPLMLGEQELARVNTDLIVGWIQLNDEVVPFFDEGFARSWLGTLAEKCNTIGKTREYDTPRGEHVVVEGGVYGWQVDYEPFVSGVMAAVNARSKEPFSVPCTSTAASVPNEFNVDFGNRYIDVNLSTQHAVFYDNGAVVWEADIVSGIPDGKHTTPNGVWEINLKESPSKLVGEAVGGSNKPEYETVVQYWMPFVGNAIGFHDATWQPGFGGSLYAAGYGSHGCVNLSYGDAEALYGIVTAGTPVITHG